MISSKIARPLASFCALSLALVLLFSGCAPAAPIAAAPAAAPQAVKVNLTVLAAASLTEPFSEIGQAFEQANPGVTIQFSFAGSQQLVQQLASGAPADVLVSASAKTMQQAVDARRAAKDSAKTFAHNRLVIVVPPSNPGKIQQPLDLAKSGLKLVLAAKEVPVGQYALDFLAKADKDSAYGADFSRRVLANVVSYEDNVKAVLTKVTLGEADAGIVYATDAASADGKVSTIEIPAALNVIATYPAAPISDSKNPAAAQAFVDFLLSSKSQEILAKYGFQP